MVAPPDIGHVAQVDQGPGTGPLPPDEQVAELLFRCEFTRGIDGQVFPAHTHVPRIRGQVFCSQGAVNVLLGDAQLGHLFPAHLHVNHFFLDPVEDDFFHVLGEEQLPLEKLGILVQFLVRVTVPRDGQVDAVHVAEVVVDDGRPRPRRQLALVVVDLAPEFIPYLGQAELVVPVLDMDLDLGIAPRGPRLDPLQLPQLLDGLFKDVGDLLFHLGGGGARIGGCHHGLLDGELGVFEPREVVEGHAPHHDQQDGQHPGDDALAQAQFRDIHRL